MVKKVQKPRDSYFLILLLVILLQLTACFGPNIEPVATPSPEPTPTEEISQRGRGDTLRILFWNAPGILNPHLSLLVKDWQASRIIYEPLASFDKDGQLIPFLAAEIPSPENGDLATDGKSVTWKLKKDIQWSDGEPFTAADVLFTFEFITNPAVESPSANIYNTVANVEIIDNHTVKINFKDVNPAWAVPFVGIGGMIIPKHKFEAYNGPNVREAPANIEPVGTGPYRVLPPGIKPQEIILLGTEIVQTNKIVFEPNPFFREEDKPYFSRIELRGGGTASEAARLSLETGEEDFAWDLTVPADELARLEQVGVGDMVVNFGTKVEQIELNRTDPNERTADGERSSLQFPHPFLSDKKVRQAIAYAIDREAIAALYGPAGEPATHILVSPPQYKSDTVFYEFDTEKAAALLDEAGWIDSDNDGIRDKDGVKLSVLFQTTANPIRQEMQKIVQSGLESIGIEVEIKIIDASVFFGSDFSNPNNVQIFAADMQAFDWNNISPDPGIFLEYWTCAQVAQKSNNWSGFNSSRFCSSEYDTLYEQSKTELDPEKRREIFVTMNDMLTNDVALIPLVQQALVSGVSNNIEGLDPTPWDTDTWNIKDWRRSP